MIRRLLLALVASLLPGAGALGAEAPASEPATLQFFNREIATFRVPAFGYSPSERVFGARARIEAAVRQEGAGEVKLRTAPEGRFVEIDGKVAFVILAGDADGTVGQTAEEAAEAVRVRLQQAVTAARESATPAALAWSLGLTGLATGLWVLLIRVLAKSNRRIGLRLSAVAADQVEKLKVSGITLLRGLYVRSAVRRIVTGVLWAVALFGTYVWLTFVLGRFAWTHPWGSRLSAYLLGVLADAGSAILHAVPGLVTVAVIVVITRWVNAVIGGFFERVASGEIAIGWLDAEIANPTRRVVIFVVWLFALAMAYPYLPGAQTEAFKGLSVLVGLMVSIGASGLVGQAASGLILMYSRTLRAGEFVRIADTEGTVTELGLFATRLRSGLGEEIVLPNALVLSNTTRNFSRVVGGPGFILHAAVTIGYDTPWRQVHAMLLEAAARTKGILSAPVPYVVQTALSDFYVEYRLVAYAGPEAPRLRAEAMSLLYGKIQDVFNEHGVQIMSPHYRNDPEAPKVVPPEGWFAAPARRDPEVAVPGPGGRP